MLNKPISDFCPGAKVLRGQIAPGPKCSCAKVLLLLRWNTHFGPGTKISFLTFCTMWAKIDGPFTSQVIFFYIIRFFWQATGLLPAKFYFFLLGCKSQNEDWVLGILTFLHKKECIRMQIPMIETNKPILDFCFDFFSQYNETMKLQSI